MYQEESKESPIKAKTESKIILPGINTYNDSKLQIALNHLGFNSDKQLSVVKLMYFTNLLSDEKIWETIKVIAKNLDLQSTDLSHIFFEIKDMLKDNNLEHLLKNFNIEAFDIEDCQDFILYLTQSLFGRAKDQERSDLKSNFTDYQEQILEATRELGMVERWEPKKNEYDIYIIFGARAAVFLDRLYDFNYNVKKSNLNIKDKKLYILTGNRPLSQIDLVNKKHLDMIKNSDASEALEDLHSQDEPDINFTEILVSAGFDDKNLNETMIAEEAVKYFPIFQDINYVIVNTPDKDGKRPTTDTTIEYFIKTHLGQHVTHNKISILAQSNNPYIERQSLSIQKSFKKMAPDLNIEIEGMGFGVIGASHSNDKIIGSLCSEFAALVSEKYNLNSEEIKKRSNETLLYSLRKNPTLEDVLKDLPHAEADIHDPSINTIGNIEENKASDDCYDF